MPHDVDALPPYMNVVVPDDDELQVSAETPEPAPPAEPESEEFDEEGIVDEAPDILPMLAGTAIEAIEAIQAGKAAPLPRRPLRIVAVGGLGNLAEGPDLAAFFSQRAEPRVFAATDLFEAGIYAASADVTIIDLNKVDFSQAIELSRTCRKLIPRAMLVGIREPRVPEASLPATLGFALSFECGTAAEHVARRIEERILGPTDGEPQSSS